MIFHVSLTLLPDMRSLSDTVTVSSPSARGMIVTSPFVLSALTTPLLTLHSEVIIPLMVSGS